MSKNGKVLVAMSGGVDSSMVAMMMHEKGYDVVGVTMKIGDAAIDFAGRENSTCCSLDAINDARDVAVQNDFPHYVLDLQDTFQEIVVDNFVEEYLAGRTPNPCVLCNKHVKWGSLIRKADQLGCEYIATGHYARIAKKDGRYFVRQAEDDRKDQSYYLWGVEQEHLARTFFPLGDYNKSETRQLAKEWGFENIANKAESVDLCFVPHKDYRTYLKQKHPDLEKLKGGKFVTTDGKVVGEHEGYPFYTIGQRKGLGVALGERMYVTHIIPETNTIVIGTRDELNCSGMWVNNITLQKYATLDNGRPAHTKVRYNDTGTSAQLYLKEDTLKVEFDEYAQGIAPGQSAVFYEGEDVLGGGRIESSFNEAESKEALLENSTG